MRRFRTEAGLVAKKRGLRNAPAGVLRRLRSEDARSRERKTAPEHLLLAKAAVRCPGNCFAGERQPSL